MALTRKVIRVFLASPGDLDNERQLARILVDQHNDAYAEALGYYIELIGWEDTVSVFGRPQEIINKELESCELFIGMLWKKWGTPPDNENRFTSGFEEEYSISFKRRKENGSPEISLFLKDIESEFLKDPGDDLKKVLAFRDNLVKSKNVLYSTFTDDAEFSAKFRKCITNYISRLKSESDHSSTELNKNSYSVSLNEDVTDKPDNGYVSKEAREIINTILEKAARDDGMDIISALEVARIRLISSSLSTYSNDKNYLGVHDNNIIFLNELKSGMKLSANEYRSLTYSGLVNLKAQNTPLWCWLKAAQGNLFWLTLSSEDNISTSAFLCLSLINAKIEDQQDYEKIVGLWFTDSSSERVSAAVLYLSLCGTTRVIGLLRDVISNNNEHRDELQKTIISILSRSAKDDALNELMNIQVSSFDQDLIQRVFAEPDKLTSNSLLSLIVHKNSQIRKNCVDILVQRKALPLDFAKKLLDDADYDIRFLCMKYLHENNVILSPEEVKNKLQMMNSGFGLYPADNDKYLKEFSSFELTQLNVNQLLKNEEIESVLSINNLLTLVNRRHNSSVNKIRMFIDDDFKSFFDEKLKNYMELHYSADLINKTYELEDLIRKEHKNKSIKALCGIVNKNDYHRIKSFIKNNNFEGCGLSEIKYLKKFGDWDDINLIISIVEKNSFGKLLLSSSVSANEMTCVGAEAMYYLGRHRIIDLLNLNMPSSLKGKIIRNLSRKVFLQLEENYVINNLLLSKLDDIRMGALEQCVKCFGKDRLLKTLKYYVTLGSYYYDVVHWLDFSIYTNKYEISHAIKNRSLLLK